MIKRWQEIRDRKEAKSFPNRRGEYRYSNYGLYKDRWKKNRKRLFQGKWQYIDSPDVRINYKSGAKHNWAHGIGTRHTRKWDQARAAEQIGFQLPIERDKPEIPGRVLRDAQEEAIWLEECDQA